MIFERLKKLYKDGKIKDLTVYVTKGLITQEQADEILKGNYKRDTTQMISNNLSF